MCLATVKLGAEAARIPWVASDSIAGVPILLSGKDVRWEMPERSSHEAEQGMENEAEPLGQEEIEFGR